MVRNRISEIETMILNNVIHHLLEGGRRIGHIKIHNDGLIGFERHNKGSFPFTTPLDLYIVVFPSEI